MINSRKKGKAGELEVAHLFTAAGFASRRGQQHKGGSDSPDILVHGLEYYYFEVKRVEKLNIFKAFEQATRDSGDKTPVVLFRRNRGEWLVCFKFQDFIKDHAQQSCKTAETA
jgi:Holliday junction resolvase